MEFREPVSEQSEFSFDSTSSADGYQHWVTVRQTTAEELGRRLGLPIGHRVEIWLRDGVRLRGKLRLQNEFLLIEEKQLQDLVLSADGISFTYPEIESCIRVDG